MTKSYLNLFVAGCMMVAIAPATAGAESNAAHHQHAVQTEQEKNKAIVKDFMELSFVQHKVREGFLKYVSPAYIQHNPNFPDGRDATIAGLEGFLAQVPGLTYDIKRILADGDIVVLHGHSRISPEDRGNAVADFFRLKDGMIVEHWDVLQPIPAEAVNKNTMF